MAPLTGMHTQLRSQGCVFGLDRKSFGYKIRNKAPLNAFTSESEFVRGHNKKVLLSFFPRKKDHSKGIKLLRRKKKQRREARSLIATCLVVLWSYVVVDENVWWS